MKVIVRIILSAFVLLCLILIISIFYFVKKTDYSSDIPVVKKCRSLDSKFDFKSELIKINLSEIKESFPYETYLELGNYCNAEAIEKSLIELDSINLSQEEVNRDVLIYALTNKLEANIINRFEDFNPDSLIMIQQWIDEFETYGKIGLKNGDVYTIVFDHWMGFISNQLGKHYDRESLIRFSFKFKYLQSFCESKKFAPAVGMSNLEKVVEYILSGEYAYLFNRFWNGTGIFIKSIIAIFFFLFIYMLYCTYRYSLKK